MPLKFEIGDVVEEADGSIYVIKALEGEMYRVGTVFERSTRTATSNDYADISQYTIRRFKVIAHAD